VIANIPPTMAFVSEPSYLNKNERCKKRSMTPNTMAMPDENQKKNVSGFFAHRL